MSTTFDLPPCPNSLNTDWKCARSMPRIQRETDEVYVVRCETCGCVNVIPKDVSENRGRYQAGLAAEARRQREEDEQKRVRTYSFGGS